MSHTRAEHAFSRMKVFSWPVRVYYEDTDVAGVVYYANYLRFLERARTEWMRALGFELTTLEHDYHCLFAVHRLEIDYRVPARLGDALDITVTLLEHGHSRLRLKQTAGRAGAILCTANVTIVCLQSQTWRPVAMPGIVRVKLEGLD